MIGYNHKKVDVSRFNNECTAYETHTTSRRTNNFFLGGGAKYIFETMIFFVIIWAGKLCKCDIKILRTRVKMIPGIPSNNVSLPNRPIVVEPVLRDSIPSHEMKHAHFKLLLL